MAPKKKPEGGGKKGKKEGDEEDTSMVDFIKHYKKKCVEYGFEQSKIIKKAWEEY